MKSSKGFSIVLAIIVALAVSLLSLSLANILNQNARENSYLEEIQRTTRIAESGMRATIGRIIIDPGLIPTTPGSYYQDPLSHDLDGGVYTCRVEKRNLPVPDCYYIQTIATRNTRAGNFKMRIHAYALLSNIGHYLFAVQDSLTVNGKTRSTGDIYASKLTFNNYDAGANHIEVKKAEYVSLCNPDPALSLPGTYGDLSSGAKIRIEQPVAPAPNPNIPQRLPYQLLFPQITNVDLERYRTLARIAGTTDERHEVCDFNGADIWPPGYEGSRDSGDPDVGGAFTPRNFVPNNTDHVYYCPGQMNIRGKVHGQILFVCENDIFITGNLTKAPVPGSPPLYPGEGSTGESTSNQAVLITPKNIFIKKDFLTGTSPNDLQTIEALLLAPHGTVIAEAYTNTAIHSSLKFSFKGSMILNLQPDLVGTFQNSRTYEHDSELISSPPPYLVPLVDIKYVFEDHVEITVPYH